MDPNSQAERWLALAGKLLAARDFVGSRTFAIRARESDPTNPISDQILAVVDTVLAAENRLETTHQPDWYSVLHLPRMVRDPDLIATHYRRLALLLSPERNRLPFADYALQLTLDAWSVLSDPTKKWLFDNELALSLQRSSPSGSTPAAAPQHQQPPAPTPVTAQQLNTFQFFQSPQHQPQQLPIWQQQQQEVAGLGQQSDHHQQQEQELPPQWQMRDPTPVKPGGGSKGSVNNGIGNPIARPAPSVTVRPVPAPAPAQPPPPPPVQVQMQVPPPPISTRIDGGGGENVVANINNNNGVASNNNNNNERVVVDEEIEGERFWTACPYCMYIYEYLKVYQDCTLRCQNCRRGFHALQIPNPPPIGGKDKEKGHDKEKENENEKENEGSFCCWGFFPLGFSMAAWKKQNQGGGGSGMNWVPFSPMFASPGRNAGFQWFASNGDACVGPKYGERRSGPSPRVYFDDDEDFVDVSEPSNSDSSDRDWRNPGTYKRKKLRRGRVGGGRRGRPKKVDSLSQGTQNVAVGGGVSVGGEDLEDGNQDSGVGGGEVVVGLVAGRKADTSSRNVTASSVMRRQTRRSAKDVGRLDLNVEFNNEGDDHAPSVSAVNGEEDVIENGGFFEGLDEFLSTLPILNVAGDEKAKPS